MSDGDNGVWFVGSDLEFERVYILPGKQRILRSASILSYFCCRKDCLHLVE